MEINKTIKNWRWWVILPLLLCVFLPLALIEWVLHKVGDIGRAINNFGYGVEKRSRRFFGPYVKRLAKWVYS